MAGVLSGAERGLLGVVRLGVVLAMAVTILFVPIVLVLTVYGAVTGTAGAVATGAQLPVRAEVVLPEQVGPPPVGVYSGAATVPAVLPAGVLPLPAVLAVVTGHAVAAVLTVLAANRLYRLSYGLTGSARFDRDVVGEVRTLAGWTVGAGLAWTLTLGGGSVLATALVGDPRLHADLALGPVLAGAGLGALLVVVTAVLRSAAELQTDRDLTV